MNRSKVTLNIESLQSIANYAHWIPITQGLHLKYFEINFPGWRWNDFVPRLIKEKIISFKSDPETSIPLGQGLFISRNIDSIEFIPYEKDVKIIVNFNLAEKDN